MQLESLNSKASPEWNTEFISYSLPREWNTTVASVCAIPTSHCLRSLTHLEDRVRGPEPYPATKRERRSERARRRGRGEGGTAKAVTAGLPLRIIG
jgi:hypothetical protein